MKNVLKSTTALTIAAGVIALLAVPANAQGFMTDGGINMGPNGAVGVFNGGAVGPGGVTGTFNTGVVGNSGGAQFTNPSFNFSLGGGPNQGGNFGGGTPGFAGQQGGGPGFVGGPAGFSQARPGDRSHQSATTNTKFQGNTGYTRKNNTSIFERSRHNLLSNGSFDQSSVPSGSWNYGFSKNAGITNMGASLLQRGWILRPTSTSSVDINTVSP